MGYQSFKTFYVIQTLQNINMIKHEFDGLSNFKNKALNSY